MSENQANAAISIADVMKSEYAKCATDAEYFMQKYCNIQTEGGRSLFSLYVFQKKLLHIIRRYDRTAVLKSRQLGITTLCACYALWLMMFHTDQKILAVAPDRDKAKHIIDKIVFAYTNLPSWMIKMCKGESIENNKHTLTLRNGSQAVAVSGSSKGARGKTATFLILDEAAFIEKAEDLWASAQQTLANSKGSAIVLSTPNGHDEFFHPLWQDAETGKNQFIPVKMKWDVHPEHDQKWRDEQDKELGKRMASQECDCSFLTSGHTYFDAEDVEYYRTLVDDNEPIERRGIGKEIWIWEHVDISKNYMVIVDTARGDGADGSGIEVIDVKTGNQVAEYYGDADPKFLAGLAVSMAIEYNNALLIIETTGIGHTTVSHVKDTGYPNIYKSLKSDTTDVSQYLNKFYKDNPANFVDGFTTSTKTRPLVLNAFRQYIIERSIHIRSKRLHQQITTFIWKGGKALAQNGRNDDLVMCYAIGMFLRDSAIEFQAHAGELAVAAIINIQQAKSFDLGYNKTKSTNFQNPWQMQVGNQQYDLSWMVSK